MQSIKPCTKGKISGLHNYLYNIGQQFGIISEMHALAASAPASASAYL